MNTQTVAKLLMFLSEQLKKASEEVSERIIEPRTSVGYNGTGLLPSKKPEVKDVHFSFSITMSESPEKVKKYIDSVIEYWEKTGVECWTQDYK